MRRRLLIGIIVVSAVLVVVLLVTLRHKDSSQTQSTPKQNVVLISNAAEFSPQLDDGLSKVEQTLYSRVKSYAVSPLSIYHGSIRRDTFKTTYTHYDQASPAVDIPTVKYIIDIPDAKQSYFVSKSGGKGYPYDILYVLCVPKEQMKYADFGCKDEF